MNDTTANNGESPAEVAAWKEVVARYQNPSVGRSIWQIVNTLVPYLALWALMYWSTRVTWTGAFYWLTLPLAVLAGGFMVRLFIIFHDCGHGSYFKLQRANHILGGITGVLTWTPYYHWRWEHALHHSSSGDLDRRGVGDLWTLTVQEYLEASRWKKFSYRLTRNPFILFVIAPLFLFIVWQRFPKPSAPAREKRSVYWTNLGLALTCVGLIWAFGWEAFLVLQLVVMGVAGSAGVWLFYVQHQFEGVYWERGENWDYATAALKGSSFYKLPKILQWFSGNIGFHHIHHLSPRIPNYNLEKAHIAEPLFQTVKPVTLFGSLKSFTFRLWDEKRRQLVGYSHLRKVRREQAHAARR